MDDSIIKLFLGLANKPNRMLSRAALERLIQEASTMKLSLDNTLYNAVYRGFFDLTQWQTKKLEEISDLLTHLHMGILDDKPAGELLNELVQKTGYLEAFQNYYGAGEHADGKILAVQNFLEYVGHTKLSPLGLLDLIEKLDTTQGAPEEEQVVFTTIFRTKGLEYDYVILPECNENALPYLKGERVDIYDLKAHFQIDPLSDNLESERRLLYVALTRARKGVFIGAGEHPSRFLAEIQPQEVLTI